MPEHTCESKITGKTVRIRHALEGDTVYMSEAIKGRSFAMEELRYEDFVVATENGKLIAFGRLSPLGEGETLWVYNSRKEKSVTELIVRHILEDAAPR